ncbi:MAG: DOMON domain-containing protein [Thermoplasmatota archaeon]
MKAELKDRKILFQMVYAMVLIIIFLCPLSSIAHEDEKNSDSHEIDGIISSNEYPNQSVFGDGSYELSWRIEDDHIFIGMRANTTGWVAIGFSPITLHEGADIVSGWVDDNGTVDIIDCYFPDMYPPHPHDTQQNGTFDVLSYNGTELNNRTTIEFSRLLSTGDELDNDILLNQSMEIFWSYGSSDIWTEKHENAGYAMVNFSAGRYTEQIIDWLGHAIVSVIGLVLAVLVVYYGAKLTGRIKGKKGAKTYKIHRIISILFGITMIGTFFYGLWVTSQHGSPVLLSVHGWLGLIIALFALAQLLPCLFVKKRTMIKIPHMMIGYILLVLVIIQVIWGVYAQSRHG